VAVFRIGEQFTMNAAPYKSGLTPLPLLAASFVVLVCVAILGMSVWREWTSRGLTLKAAEVDMANLARSLTQHAEDSIDLLDGSILGAITRLETDGTGPDTLSKLEKVLVVRKAALQRIYNIVICDEGGSWMVAAVGVGPSLKDREFFLHHRQSSSRAAFIGKPVVSVVDGAWITTVSRRFNHPDGSFAGVVVATIGAEYFSEFYRQFETGTNGAIALLNAGGFIMARSPDNATYVGRDLSNAPLFKDPSLQSRRGVYHFKSPLDGMQRVSFYQRSDRFPLVVLATAQLDEVLAPWRRAATTRLLFVLGLLILIAVMGHYLVRQLLRGQRMAAALAAKETNFRVLAEGSSDMVTRIGLDERVYYASPSSTRIVGWSPGDLVGTPAMAGVNREDLPRVQEAVAALKQGEAEEARITYRTRHRQKSEIWVESTLRVTRSESGEIDGVVAISRDMTQQKDLEEKLETLATIDSLTDLANRRRFDECLAEEWGRAYRERSCLALLMIDVDHFKSFNDEYGHPAGDECLRAVARVLVAEAQRPADLAARYGGEEFVILLPNTDAAGCERIGERIRRALRDAGIPHASSLPSGLLTTSLGGAVCRPGPEKSLGHASLVEAADRALYAAKDGGRNRLVMSAEVVTLRPAAAG
jgi:diguanylate cyclase (GGDEF)-like protein/PAS domain S-box-containing protein